MEREVDGRLGICAGKHSVAKYLVENHGFQHLRVLEEPQHGPGYQPQLPKNALTDASYQSFRIIDELLEFVAARWDQRWVTTDMWDDAILDALLLRPYFFLVSIDAPITLRWRRFSDKCVALPIPVHQVRFSH